jgi:hypothetical protein
MTNDADVVVLQSPMSSIAMVDMTRRPQRYDVCASSAAMAGSNAKNVTLQFRALWRCKSQ